MLIHAAQGSALDRMSQTSTSGTTDGTEGNEAVEADAVVPELIRQVTGVRTVGRDHTGQVKLPVKHVIRTVSPKP